MRCLISLFLAFLLVPVLTAPTGPPAQPKPLTVPNHGDFVGVRPGAYEKGKDSKRVTIHPGVVVSGPHSDGRYKVAMISKNLPHDPPQHPIHKYHPESSVYGNVHLGPPKKVELRHMKPWKDETTGRKQTPMNHQNLERLKTAMAPHTGWKAPTPPPSPPPSPGPPRPKTPPPKASGSHIPVPKKPNHVNAHASGSKHPPAHPVGSGSRSGNWRKASPPAQRPNPGAAHHPSTNNHGHGAGKKPAVAHAAHKAAAHAGPSHGRKSPEKRPAGKKRSLRSR